MSLPGAEAFWLNFKTNVTSARVPAELPEELAEEIAQQPSSYWFNEVTGVSQWEDPKESSWNSLTVRPRPPSVTAADGQDARPGRRN